MNHTLLIVCPIWVSAVPVLPATRTPGIWACVPVPLCTTRSIIAVTSDAVEGFITVDCTWGLIVFTRASVRVDHAVGHVRLHELAAVGDRRGDLRHLQRHDRELVLADRHAPDVDDAATVGESRWPLWYSPLADIWSAG